MEGGLDGTFFFFLYFLVRAFDFMFGPLLPLVFSHIRKFYLLAACCLL